VAALYYALSIGAVYVEHTALLEPPATTVLLLALVITRLLGPATGVRTGHYVAAGLLLGLSPVLKIWGVVAVLVVAGGIVYRRGWRPGLTTLFAAMASCAALCLPFFLAAPGQMWRMVVVAQVGRRRVNESEIERLNDVLGVREWLTRPNQVSLLLVVVALVLLASLVVCVVRPELRVIAALMITHGALVMSTPMWFLHYAGLTPAPIALTLGGALAVLLAWCGNPRLPGTTSRWLPSAVAGAAALAVLILAIPMPRVDLGGRPFPARTLAAGVVDRPGCITTDWPAALLLMDLMQRNIDRGCPFVVDLGGYSYYQYDSPYAEVSRRKNEDWQRLALEYYRTGDSMISIRFDTTSGFSKETARTVKSWPILVESGRYEIREPQPAEK
jgi:alpha-1,2-mannosyltransferase